MSEESDMWKQCVENMKNSIHELSENQWIFLINYEPNENTGYYLDDNNDLNKIKKILTTKTDPDGHSGCSFTLCLRQAINDIRNSHIVTGEEV